MPFSALSKNVMSAFCKYTGCYRGCWSVGAINGRCWLLLSHSGLCCCRSVVWRAPSTTQTWCCPPSRPAWHCWTGGRRGGLQGAALAPAAGGSSNPAVCLTAVQHTAPAFTNSNAAKHTVERHQHMQCYHIPDWAAIVCSVQLQSSQCPASWQVTAPLTPAAAAGCCLGCRTHWGRLQLSGP
jgi:hypothetical protein